MRKVHAMAATAAVLMAGGSLIALSDSRPSGNPTASRSADEKGVAPAGGSALLDAGDSSFAAPTAARVEPAATPRVVKTASLHLSVDRNSLVAKATAQANRIAEAHGGFVASTDSSRGDDATTSLTLRVPAANYDAALTELRRLGEVNSETLGGKDVTGALVDLEARLRSLRAQEAALNALMAKANTVGETLQVAQAVADVRTRIEQLAAQQSQLADQADFATITVEIVGPNAAIERSPGEDPLLVSSLRRAVGATLEVLGGALVLLGYLLPAALLAALGYGLWRLLGRLRPAVA